MAADPDDMIKEMKEAAAFGADSLKRFRRCKHCGRPTMHYRPPRPAEGFADEYDPFDDHKQENWGGPELYCTRCLMRVLPSAPPTETTMRDLTHDDFSKEKMRAECHRLIVLAKEMPEEYANWRASILKSLEFVLQELNAGHCDLDQQERLAYLEKWIRPTP